MERALRDASEGARRTELGEGDVFERVEPDGAESAIFGELRCHESDAARESLVSNCLEGVWEANL